MKSKKYPSMVEATSAIIECLTDDEFDQFASMPEKLRDAYCNEVFKGQALNTVVHRMRKNQFLDPEIIRMKTKY